MFAKAKHLGKGSVAKAKGLGPSLGAGRSAGAAAITSFQTKSIAFGGTDEYASRADAAAHDLSTNISVSLWVKGSNNSSGGLVNKGDYGANNIAYYCTQDGNDPTKMGIVLSSTGQSDLYWRTSVTVFDGAWHHVAWTFVSGTPGTLKLYVDGAEDTNPTKVNTSTPNSLRNSSIGLHLGALMNSGSRANFYIGRMCSVSIWSATLSAAEITELYNTGKTSNVALHSQYANCVSWYQCGDGDTIGADGIVDTKGALHLSPSNMEAGDIVSDAP